MALTLDNAILILILPDTEKVKETDISQAEMPTQNTVWDT